MMLHDRQVQHSTIISHLEIEMEMSLQVMICDTMIAVHYGHLSHLLQTLGLGAVLVSACQHRSRSHMQLGGI